MFDDFGYVGHGEFVISKQNREGEVRVMCLGIPGRTQTFQGYTEALEYICSFPDEEDFDA